MTEIILSGASGKMGKVIARLAEDMDDIRLVCGFDLMNSHDSAFPIYSKTEGFTGHADVLVDFSHPSALEGLIKYCLVRRIPAVIATTGLSMVQIALLRKAATEIPIFYSANMSLGVNLIIELAQKAARVLENNFDIEIIEGHHNQKIDAPSGTALAIADAITSVLNQPKEYVYDRHSVRKKRGKSEIGIHSIRGGTIVGDHSVIFAGTDEVIEIKHSATSKEVFAVGALRAATFLSKKPSGFYNMQDLVKEL